MLSLRYTLLMITAKQIEGSFKANGNVLQHQHSHSKGVPKGCPKHNKTLYVNYFSGKSTWSSVSPCIYSETNYSNLHIETLSNSQA